MSHFNTLTDIVTCNLTSILRDADDPAEKLDSLIAEMHEAINTAQRSIKTHNQNEERITQEIEEHNRQVADWQEDAKAAMAGGDENQARVALLRKREVESLIAALEREYVAVRNIREHVTTLMLAIQARLSDAQRRKHGDSAEASGSSDASQYPESSRLDQRDTQIEAELSALREELGGGT